MKNVKEGWIGKAWTCLGVFNISIIIFPACCFQTKIILKKIKLPTIASRMKSIMANLTKETFGVVKVSKMKSIMKSIMGGAVWWLGGWGEPPTLTSPSNPAPKLRSSNSRPIHRQIRRSSEIPLEEVNKRLIQGLSGWELPSPLTVTLSAVRRTPASRRAARPMATQS